MFDQRDRKFGCVDKSSHYFPQLTTTTTNIRQTVDRSANVSMKDINKIVDFRQEYLSHRDINNYIDTLQSNYPHLVHVHTIGHSFEKRTLKSVHISTSMVKQQQKQSQPLPFIAKSALLRNQFGPIRRFSADAPYAKQKPNLISNRKPVILIDGGMHAREWCTISAALNCATQLTENFAANKDLLDAFDFVIVPIVNADGYEYSRQFVCIQYLTLSHSLIQ